MPAASNPVDSQPRRLLAPFGRFDRYLLREVAGPIVLVLAAMLVALMLERTLRLIHELAASGSDIGYLLPLLRELLPYYLELAIPFAFMVALAVLVVRLDRRLELEGMLAAGVSLSRIAAPLVGLGAVLALLALVAGGWLEPYGRYAYRALRIDAANAGRVSVLQPRALFQPDDGLMVTFDRLDVDGDAAGVFLWQQLDDGGEMVVTAASGKIGFSPAGHRLGIDFRSGRQVIAGSSQSFDFETLQFRQSLELEDSAWKRGWDQKELTLPELIAEARHPTRDLPPRAVAAELYERIARVMLIVLLPLLVLPLAFATKKGGRALGLLLCGAFLAATQHALNAAKKVSLTGAIEPSLAILGTAGALALLILALFVSARRLPSESPLHSLLDPVAKAFARRAPKAGATPGLRGRSLGAYVAWEFAKWTLLALATMAVFLQAIELVERGDQFVERGLGLADAGYYALLRFPSILRQAMPMAALAGALAAFAQLASEREITAMRAMGVSQWRLLAMAAPVALALFGAVFVLVEWTVPASQQRLARWWDATAPAQAAEAPRPHWFRIEDEIVRADAASADGRRLNGVRIYARDAQGRLAQRVSAATARYTPDGWSLAQVETTRLSNERVTTSRSERGLWRVALDPDDVSVFFAEAPEVSAEMAQRALAQAAPASLPDTVFATRLQRSAAEPLGPLLMLLFAVPLAFAVPRTGRYWPATLYAAGAGLVYLVADGVLTAAAQVGYVPALIGAWGAPVLAGLVGLNVLVLSER